MRRIPEDPSASAPAKPKARHAVLAGLIGRGIQASRTPAMHEAEGAAIGLEYEYRLLDTELLRSNPTIADILKGCQKSGFAGLNITYPYKIAVIEHLDELSEAASSVGAVNTIVFRDGKLFGHNTDLWGFRESFTRDLPDVARNRVLLLGAGGAGAAVAHALLQSGVGKLLVRDIDRKKAVELVTQLNERVGAGRADFSENSGPPHVRLDGIVNATPVGMKKLPGSPYPVDLLNPDQWVADIVYFPIETELLRAARQAGCRTMSGAGMALFQAVRAFELITGRVPDSERMKAVFDAFDRTDA
jgi:quinate/shikimate dehydrogenase (NAD+)